MGSVFFFFFPSHSRIKYRRCREAIVFVTTTNYAEGQYDKFYPSSFAKMTGANTPSVPLVAEDGLSDQAGPIHRASCAVCNQACERRPYP